MSTLSLATRNLLRNQRRSIATLSALAIGAASVLLFGGYSADIRNGMVTSYVQDGGHLQIQHKDFFLYGNGNPTVYGIANYQRILDAIRDDAILKPMVKVVTPTLQFVGIAGNYAASVSRTVIGMGYVAADVSRMRDWNEFGLPQQRPPYALLGAADDVVLLGIGVARVLLLCAPLGIKDCPQPQADARSDAKADNRSDGKTYSDDKGERKGVKKGRNKVDKDANLPADIAALSMVEQNSSKSAPAKGKIRIELLASQPRGSPNVASLDVVGAEDQGFKDLDEVTVILQLRQAQKLIYGRDAGRATSIMIQLVHTDRMAAATARLQAILKEVAPDKPLVVVTFEAINPWYTQTVQLFDTIFGFIFGLIGAIVLFTVSNTMTAAVVERTAEIGTVRAIGLRQSGVRWLFLTEGLLLGFSGAAVGLIFALLVSTVVNHSGLSWLPPGSSSPLPLTVRVWGENLMILGTMLGLTCIAALSAWWPAWRAAKLSIVDALRHA